MKQWDILRRWVMLIVGSILLALALFSDHGNMQIEGLFFAVLTGSGAWIVLHYAIAKIIGTLVFGRIWCGWACWFGMVFDWLPYPHPRYRRPGQVEKLRYLHFAASIALVAFVWFVLGQQGAVGTNGMIWFVGGFVGYQALGIGMAFAFKDNRAFCKYLCPLGVLMKMTSRFSLIKIKGVASKCDSCNVCVEMCPMNIRIPDYILNGKRVLSTECTLCQTCVLTCPTKALGLSVNFDLGGIEYTDYEPPKHLRQAAQPALPPPIEAESA